MFWVESVKKDRKNVKKLFALLLFARVMLLTYQLIISYRYHVLTHFEAWIRSGVLLVCGESVDESVGSNRSYQSFLELFNLLLLWCNAFPPHVPAAATAPGPTGCRRGSSSRGTALPVAATNRWDRVPWRPPAFGAASLPPPGLCPQPQPHPYQHPQSQTQPI